MAYEAKTKPTDADVHAFLAGVENPKRRADGQAVCALLTEVSAQPPVMWGPNIVGFGSYLGSTGAWPVLAFSPRKPHLALYGLGSERKEAFLARLGKHKTSGGCIYVSNLAAVDLDVLREMAVAGQAATLAQYPRA